MNIAQSPLQQPRSLTGIGISLAVHLLLVVLWQASRPPLLPDDTPPEMQFVRVLPVPEAANRPLAALPVPVRRPTAPQAQPAAQAAAPSADAPTASTTLPAEPTDQPAAPAPSTADLLQQAKAAAGGIDSALRKENPRRGIQAPIVTATMKLERGIARAAEMAPNKWYEAPKVHEVLDPGGYGRRRYRVITARGTYCVTYESNHGPDGRDTMRDGIPPKKTNCDPDEEPATSQDWNHKGL
ncbi:hypothetical protein [Massilia niabensis]|uniref:Type II secretion system protein GspG C-terminal domain-containing protein n=1 Tax=Massilia niabensis TaxID=544910 RepID=A0ABW0LB99_9BURK